MNWNYAGLCCALLVSACAADGGKERAVARIEGYSVTEEHFESAFRNVYVRTGSAMPINNETKKSVLEHEFEGYVLAVYAEEIGLAASEKAVREKGTIERRLLVDEWMKKNLFDTLSTDQRLARELFRRSKTYLRASHLYAPDKVAADSMYRLLREQKATFEELASSAFQSKYLARNGGDLGLFTYDEMDMNFEEAAYRLDVGEISPPVKTSYGYSIIKLTGRYPEPIITEQQYLASADLFEQHADKRLRMIVSDQHLEDISAGYRYSEVAMSRLWDLWEKRREEVLQDGGLDRALASGLDGKEALAEGFNRTVNVADVLGEMYYTPEITLQSIRNRRMFEEMVKGLVYRNHVVAAAAREGIRNTQRFKKNSEYAFTRSLARIVEEQMALEVPVPAEDIRRVYEQQRQDFVAPASLNLSRIVLKSRSEADGVLKMIRNGMSFDEAVRLHSLDTELARFGGNMGFTPVNQLGTLAPTLNKLKPGDLSAPIEYAAGRFHIYKLLERRDARPLRFEEAAPDIEAQLKKELVSARKAVLIEEVKKRHRAFVDYGRLEQLKMNI